MKKASMIVALAMLLMMSGVYAYADVGMPPSPKYTVVITIYGADCYKQYSDYESGTPSGTVAGGQAFYVWGENGDSLLWGTTDPDGSANDTSSFVLVSTGDVMDPSDMVSEDAGIKTEETIFAVTTDELNVRSGPGTGFNIMTTLDKGTTVQYDYVLTNTDSWAYVAGSNIEGWVSTDYLSRTQEPQKNTEPAGTGIQDTTNTGDGGTDIQDTTENNSAASRELYITGIVMICIGAAILIATVAAYLLSKNKNSYR